MRKIFIQPLATFAVGALISVQAMAFGSHQRGIDWEEELDLTEQQEDQIEAIEDRYQGQFHEMKKGKGQRHERHQHAATIMKQMRQEIQQVLTKEQRAQARKLMTERRHQAMEKRLKKLARKLDMTEEQKSQLQQTLKTQRQQYQWPMDQEQRQQARVTFDTAMAGILTSDQQQQWQAMKAKSKKRWHHDKQRDGDEEYYKNSYEEHPSRGGLRKGYQSW
jgi:Spy/CpxP family protein refolding chaperone